MKWTKASERLPEHGDLYFVKMSMKDSGLPWFPDTCNYYDEWQDVGEDYEVLEWLDESGIDEIEKLKKENEELRFGVEHFIKWLQEHRPNVAGLGAPIHILKELLNKY